MNIFYFIIGVIVGLAIPFIISKFAEDKFDKDGYCELCGRKIDKNNK